MQKNCIPNVLIRSFLEIKWYTWLFHRFVIISKYDDFEDDEERSVIH